MSNSTEFKVGDRAILLACTSIGHWIADFNNQGNPKVRQSGKWVVGKDFRLVGGDK